MPDKNEYLLEKIKLGTKNTRLVFWPGTQDHVLIRILSINELQECVFNTEHLFKAQKIETNLMTSTEWDDERATQILFKSLRDPSNQEKPVCSDMAQFRLLLTRDERNALLLEYLAFEKEVSPLSENLSSDEFDRTLQSIKKNPELIMSGNYSIFMLKKLLHFLVSQPAT